MENVKAGLSSSLPAAENSVLPEPVSGLEEKTIAEKEFDETDLIPYLTIFRHMVSDALPDNSRLVASRGVVNTTAMLPASSDISDNFGKGAALQSSIASTVSQRRAGDATRLAAAPAAVPAAVPAAIPAAVPAAVPASATALPSTDTIASDAFMAAEAEKKGKDARNEANNILAHGTQGLSGTLQADVSLKSKAENPHALLLKQAEQDVSSMVRTEASSRLEHGETRITYTFRRWDTSNRHAVEFTIPKDQLTQPLIMTPTTREVRERIDVARDAPGAPIFSLREEGEQHNNRRNAWRFYDEEDA